MYNHLLFIEQNIQETNIYPLNKRLQSVEKLPGIFLWVRGAVVAGGLKRNKHKRN